MSLKGRFNAPKEDPTYIITNEYPIHKPETAVTVDPTYYKPASPSIIVPGCKKSCKTEPGTWEKRH